MKETPGGADAIRFQLDYHRMLRGISAGAVNGILTVMLQISFAAMIFSGPLSHLFPRGVGLTLFGGLVFGVVLALTSSLRGVVALVQDAPCAILALAAAAVVSGLPASTPDSDVYFTVVAVIVVSSILTGVVFYLMGRFRLGDLVRFIPYPVDGEVLESVYEETMTRLVQQEALESLIHSLADYSTVLHLDKDTMLVQQGDPPAGLYFIETGEVTAWLERRDGTRIRLRTYGMGSVVGELSLYTNSAATATVLVSRPTVAYHLSMETLERLEKKDPDLTAGLHRAMVRVVAERLVDATASMQSIL